MSAASSNGTAGRPGSGPLQAVRQRSRDRTAQELQYAILRVKNKGTRMSIRAVALEAGVDPSLLHNTYPDIAEEIRSLVGRGTRRQRDEARADVTALRRHLRNVTVERDELNKAMAVLVSVNLALSNQLAELKAEADGKLRRLVSNAAGGQ